MSRISSSTPNSDVSVNVRKIANGYVISKSSTSGGDYSCTEHFSEAKPTVTVPEVQMQAKASPNPFKGAMDELKRR